MQKAQTIAIRHTVHHKPQMYMGNLRPFGCSSITFVRSYPYGGDCVAIELNVFALLSDCKCKDTLFYLYFQIISEKTFLQLN